MMHSVQLSSDSGVPLLLLHGWGHDHRALQPLGELLANCRPVHLLDLPGFGNSPAPEKNWGARDYAEELLAYLKQQQIKKCDLFGHSFGGKVSATFASLYPEKVRKVVLCNASGMKKRKSSRGLLIKTLAKATKGVDRTLKTDLFKTKFIPRYASADYRRSSGIMRQVLVKAVNEEICDLAPAIKADTLLIWGEADKETPLDQGKEYHRLIPHSKLLCLEGKGHSPFMDAGHHLLTHYMEPFLS